MLDAEFRGRTIGLKQELSSYFTAQLTLQRELKTDGCPRSDACLDGGTNQEDWAGAGGQHEVEKCLACGRLRSVVLPPHLAYPVATATELDLLKAHNYTAAVELSPFDWECLRALEAGRRESEIDEREQVVKDAEFREREAAFQANTQKMRGK